MKRRVIIWAALILSLVISWVMISWFEPTVELMPDSCYYLRVARNISSGKFYVAHRAGVDRYMTVPLYPLLINFASRFTRDFEKAGRVVSVMAALLLVVVLFGWGSGTWGLAAGITAALLVAISQGRWANFVLVESLFTLLYTAAAWLIWKAFNRPSFLRAAMAGLIVGLAALSKETGLIALPLGVITLLFATRENEPPLSLRKRFVNGTTFTVTACLMLLPYWAYSLWVRGDWWGSRFAERASHGAGGFSGVLSLINKLPAAGIALWESYPAPVVIAAVIGLIFPLMCPSRGDGYLRILIAGWIVGNVLAVGLLGVTQVLLWKRYLCPVGPLLLLMAARGVAAVSEFVGLQAARSKSRYARATRFGIAAFAVAGLILPAARHARQERNALLDPSYQTLKFIKGSKEVANDFLSNYTILPGTYVYDRKPFVAYYLGATWAGLPPKITLNDLAREAKKRPVLLVVSNFVIFSFGYEQFRSLLLAKSVPRGWHLLQMNYFPQYSKRGRIFAIYSYGDAYPPPPPVNPEDFTYEEHIQKGKRWLDVGRIDRARAHLEAAIHLAPSRKEAYVLLADILRTQGNIALSVDTLEESLELAKRAAALDSGDRKVRHLMCRVSEAKSALDGTEPLCK